MFLSVQTEYAIILPDSPILAVVIMIAAPPAADALMVVTAEL